MAKKTKTAAAKPNIQPKTARKPRKKQTKTGEPKEIGGPKGPEPTRYGDWERNGIVSDF
jgi:hypothetical protein